MYRASECEHFATGTIAITSKFGTAAHFAFCGRCLKAIFLIKVLFAKCYFDINSLVDYNYYPKITVLVFRCMHGILCFITRI